MLAQMAKFTEQLRAAYETGTYTILQCFDIYLDFLNHTAPIVLTESTKWQYDDMRMSIYNDKIDYNKVPLETVWNKNRRSAKTRDATKLAVFFSLMNYECIWRTPIRKQLKMSYKWYMMNPFVDKIRSLSHEVTIHNSPYIDIAVLSPGNCTGIEGNVILLDEGGWVEQGKMTYEGYKQARPMIATTDFKHILHFSTPARNTALEEAWIAVAAIEQKLNTTLRVERTVEDCPWITEEFVESERVANFDCPWYIEQNYYGVFVVYGGAVFNTPIDISQAPKHIQDHWNITKPDVGGVDFNMPVNGHYLVTGNIFDDYLFIRTESVFDELSDLKSYVAERPALKIEIEDGGFNLPYVDECYYLNIPANYLAWTDIEKMVRVRKLQSYLIYIDKLACPLTYRNIKDAGYDQTSRLPKLQKTTGQHGLDCSLHLVGMVNMGKIVYSTQPRAIKRNPFKKQASSYYY